MKKISVMVTTYNEKDNVVPLGEALIQLFQDKLSHYEYEILFMDNCSTDGTQQRIDELCCKYSQIRAIFNARNWLPPFRLLWAAASEWGLCNQTVRRFSGPAGDDPAICPGVGKWI